MEIKFRVWDSDDMFYFNKYVFNTELFEMSWECANPPEIGAFGTRLDDNAVIMQYTGLKDKNGKEIYEGDIVSINHKNHVGTVKYGNGSYWIDEGKHGENNWKLNVTSAKKVIGNIYEEVS